jgi:hypothetical protein
MGIINKLKSFFFEREDKKEEVQEPKQDEKQESPELQPKGELVGQCSLCGLAIGSEDNTRNFNGNIAHKRCVKKATKMFLRGENFANGI